MSVTVYVMHCTAGNECALERWWFADAANDEVVSRRWCCSCRCCWCCRFKSFELAPRVRTWSRCTPRRSASDCVLPSASREINLLTLTLRSVSLKTSLILPFVLRAVVFVTCSRLIFMSHFCVMRLHHCRGYIYIFVLAIIPKLM